MCQNCTDRTDRSFSIWIALKNPQPFEKLLNDQTSSSRLFSRLVELNLCQR